MKNVQVGELWETKINSNIYFLGIVKNQFHWNNSFFTIIGD